MVRTYKRKTERGKADDATIRLAVDDVKGKKGSVRKIAKDYGINYRSLYRYCGQSDGPQQENASPREKSNQPPSSGPKKSPLRATNHYAKPKLVRSAQYFSLLLRFRRAILHMNFLRIGLQRDTRRQTGGVFAESFGYLLWPLSPRSPKIRLHIRQGV